MKRIIGLLIAIFTISITLQAQSEAKKIPVSGVESQEADISTITVVGSSYDDYPDAELTLDNLYGPYLTNRFQDNWFISLAMGTQTYMGSDYSNSDMFKHLWPIYSVSLGKSITPSVGVRLLVAYGRAKGWGSENDGYIDLNDPVNGGYRKEYNYFTYHADFMYNVSAAVAGYNPKRVYEFIPYAGFGLARSSAHTHEIMFCLGLHNRFRLANRLDLNLTFNLNFADAQINRNQNLGEIEYQMGLLAGFTYRFDSKIFKRAQKCVSETKIVNKIVYMDPNGNRYSSQEALMENNKPEPTPVPLVTAQTFERPAEVVEPVGTIEPVKLVSEVVAPEFSVFFSLNSDVLSNQDKINLRNYAAVIGEDNEIKCVLIGYADLETGGYDHNVGLAKRRAINVFKYLTETLGVDKELIITRDGDLKNPPYKECVNNRTVIIKTK